MTSTEHLELLMQRAADGELSEEQRHELMELVEHHPDGWRQLACRFLEEQLFSQSMRQTPLAGPPVEESIVRPMSRPIGFWYHHPALTTAVTIVLAFALGLTVPWNRDADRRDNTVLHTQGVDFELRPELEALRRHLEAFNGPLPRR